MAASGRPGGPPPRTRREAVGALSALALGSTGCRKPPDPSEPAGAIQGNDVDRGHRLRETHFPAPSSAVKRTVVVVGAGIAGLSAAWRLSHAGVDDVEVLELGDQPGGTARSGHNDVSAYPWGAHYAPVPNPESTIALRLLDELGLVVGRDSAGGPLFDERHLVHEPEDRTFFRGVWQSGLYLELGASPAELREREAFHRFVTDLRGARGRDGRPFFAIPTALSSTDPEALAFDRLTMATLLDRKGWRSPRLRAYVDYGCRDDYGAGVDTVSAWAGLHYFSGRRPLPTPGVDGTHYFTWPEGNAHLVAHLRRRAPRLTTGRLVHRVGADGTVDALDAATETTVRYHADHVVLATPNHVTARLTGGARRRFALHAPWLVANLTLRSRPPGAEPCWNNVLYESTSVGYVESTNPRFGPREPAIWSWYEPLDAAQRPWLLQAPWQTLAARVMADLRPAFGDLRGHVDRVDVWRWGHGTLVPAPGMATSADRHAAAEPLGRIHFAHTDLSGLPLYEEAQYRGVLAAEAILERMGIGGPRWAG